MTDDPRIQQLLDELLAARSTPEVVCEPCPELLPAVRNRWRQICRLRADLNALFPSPDAPTPWPPEETALPQVPGYEVEARHAQDRGLRPGPADSRSSWVHADWYPLGMPSYMAPEQALGKVRESGPAATDMLPFSVLRLASVVVSVIVLPSWVRVRVQAM
jgi:hypothetical protein